MNAPGSPWTRSVTSLPGKVPTGVPMRSSRGSSGVIATFGAWIFLPFVHAPCAVAATQW